MKSTVLLSLAWSLLWVSVELGATSPNHHHHHLWQLWKLTHRKQYDNSSHETQRLNIWKMAVDQIREHNLRHDLGLESYRMAVNQFTDLTWDEFKQQYLGSLFEVSPEKQQVQNVLDDDGDFVDTSDIPDEWDWRKHNRVTNVKDQLVDCSGPFGTYGCDGGYMTSAFKYAAQYGMESDADYPYKAQHDRCQYNESAVIVQVDTYRQVKYGNEDDLLDALYRVGPVAVAVNVQKEFMYYGSGIFTSKTCSTTQLGHAILAVGFGQERGQKYWLVKNSWGTWWGEKGYIRMARGLNNMCGIASMASVPTLK